MFWTKIFNRRQIGWAFFLSLWASQGLAYGGFGAVSDNLLGPISGFSQLLNGVSYTIGVGFLLGGLVQYRQHRENPQQIKISTPIVLALIGLIFVALPFITRLSPAAHALG